MKYLKLIRYPPLVFLSLLPLAFSIYVFVGPNHDSIKNNDFKSEGCFVPGGFVYLSAVLRLDAVNGWARGRMIVQTKYKNQTIEQKTKSFDNKWRTVITNPSTRPIKSTFLFEIPKEERFSVENITFIITTDLLYPKRVKGGFVNEQYKSSQIINVPISIENSICNNTRWTQIRIWLKYFYGKHSYIPLITSMLGLCALGFIVEDLWIYFIRGGE